MASDQGGVSTAPPIFSATISEAAPAQSAPELKTTPREDEGLSRTKSLKRARPESSHYPPNLSSIANAGLVGSPLSPKSPRSKGIYSPGYYAAPMTGAAALEDARRREEAQRSHTSATSENPGHKVMSSLLAGGGTGISRPSEAPTATTTMSEGLSIVANAVSLPSTSQYDDKPIISPVSSNGFGGLGLSAATATASPTIVASPAAMTSAEPESHNATPKPSNPSLLHPQPDEHPSNRAFSFPGNLLAQPESAKGPSRGLSLPVPSQQLAPRSPSQKKHKCPYCDTEFTRHHNLKSHLLTHSQEKPYVCQTCTMRFRRLHDLKRHMKLHTGERPHVCPKCDRKFARGDALARHSKGQGGCAGRRASMGSFGGDEEYDEAHAGEGEEGMDGVMYTNGNPADAEAIEEDRRRMSLPSIKAQHVQGTSGGASEGYTHSRGPSTYPPAGPRPTPSSGGLYPPSRDRAGSGSSVTSMGAPSNVIGGHSPNTSISSIPASGAGSSIYSQGSMTESPKPLSPTAMQSHQLGHESSSIHRQRSPSLTAQFQQQQYGRRPSGRGSPPISLPSPHMSQGPKLPALSNLAPPDSRYALQGPNQVSPVGTSPTTLFQPPMGSRIPGPPQHQVLGSNDNNLFAKGENGMVHYVAELEGQVKQLNEKVQIMETREKRQEEHIARLSEELYALRNQIQQQQQQHAAPHHA